MGVGVCCVDSIVGVKSVFGESGQAEKGLEHWIGDLVDLAGVAQKRTQIEAWIWKYRTEFTCDYRG